VRGELDHEIVHTTADIFSILLWWSVSSSFYDIGFYPESDTAFMIGDRFIRFLKPQPPRYLPRLHNFIRFQARKMSDGQMRSAYITPNSPGCRLLMEIIKLADVSVLLDRAKEDLSSLKSLVPLTKDLEKPIDARIGRTTPSSLFIQSRTPCFELMTASRRTNPLIDIPWGKAYGHPDWATIRPFRIVDMGATELHYQVYTEQLIFTRLGPTHAVYALDCVALVASCVTYLCSLSTIPDLDQAILDFLHTDIIVPTLLHDSASLWLRSTYKQQFLSSSPLESRTTTMWDAVNIDSLGTDYTGGMMDVAHLRHDLLRQSIHPLSVLSSLPLTPDGQSVSDYYTQLWSTTDLSVDHAYVWIACLKNIAWWEFVLTITSFSPSYPDVQAFHRAITRDVRFWVMMRPWQNVHSSLPYRKIIQTKLEGLLDYLNEL
jgi:hypothetical protein